MTFQVLVGALLRAHVPLAGATTPVHFHVLGTQADSVEIETVPLPSDEVKAAKLRAWVSLAELTFLLRCELIVVLDTSCGECGAMMQVITDGFVDDRPVPFLACTGCEMCYEL